ncbi:MAG TPA: hypothetical protein VKB96_06855 [Gammaproteobacteria bacterium]|nr:hypothetical protein [Gammaproteobacteria bacterium]
MEAEKGELAALELEVLKKLKEQEILAKNPEVDSNAQRTLDKRLADRITTFGGSWTFIIIFMFILLAWIFVNS